MEELTIFQYEQSLMFSNYVYKASCHQNWVWFQDETECGCKPMLEFWLSKELWVCPCFFCVIFPIIWTCNISVILQLSVCNLNLPFLGVFALFLHHLPIAYLLSSLVLISMLQKLQKFRRSLLKINNPISLQVFVMTYFWIVWCNCMDLSFVVCMKVRDLV